MGQDLIHTQISRLKGTEVQPPRAVDNMTDQLPSRDSIFALNAETLRFTPTKSLCLE